MNTDDGDRLERLRRQLEEQQSLIRLEREKAELSVEILESVLLRIAALERRVDGLESG